MKKFLVLWVLLISAFLITTAYANPALVVMGHVKKGTASEITKSTGNLYFEKTSLVSAEIAGKAESVYFMEGDRVKKGAKLLKIDTKLLEKELSLQKSQLAQIDIRIEKTGKDLNRYEKLYKNEAASESSYDDLKFGYAGLLEEKAALLKSIDMTNIKLEKSVVYSPFTGIVIEKTVEKGNWVQPGASIARIGSLDSISVKVPLSEKLISFSKKGDNVGVRLAALNKDLKGRVIGLIPYADPKTRNLFLKIGIDYKGPIAENMSVIVDLPSSPQKEVYVVPRDAVVSFGPNKMIYTIKDNKAVPLPVQVVGYNGSDVQISSHLISEDMAIVVEGNQRLRPDQAVSVVKEK